MTWAFASLKKVGEAIRSDGWQEHDPFDEQSPRLNAPFLPSSACDCAESCPGNVRWERRWDGLGAPFYWQVLFQTVLGDVFPLSFLLSRTVLAMFFDDGRDFFPRIQPHRVV